MSALGRVLLFLACSSAARALTIIYPVEAIADLWQLPYDEFREKYAGINITGLGPSDEGWFVRYRHENLTYLFGPLTDSETARRSMWELEAVRDAAIRNRESLASSRVDVVKFNYSGVYGRAGDGSGSERGGGRLTDVDGKELGGTGDLDGDGIPDNQDPDIDGDGIPNELDPDIDGDGIPNELDGDMDGDGIPNEMDGDIDGDGIPNSMDRNPRTYNRGQDDMRGEAGGQPGEAGSQQTSADRQTGAQQGQRGQQNPLSIPTPGSRSNPNQASGQPGQPSQSSSSSQSQGQPGQPGQPSQQQQQQQQQQQPPPSMDIIGLLLRILGLR